MASQSMNHVAVYWEPPSPGWLKLNSDGSSLENSGQTSYGGLIRNDHGGWLCGYAGKMGCDTGIASEIRGIYEGLSLIRTMKLEKVVVETDCQAALLLITVAGVDDSHPQSFLIKECKRGLQELNCYMVHVKRDGNRCADLMAKLGGTQDEQFIVYNEPPSMLIPFLVEDQKKTISILKRGKF